MIKFENTVVSGWEAAIRGCRNPMNSWDKSDTVYYRGDAYCEQYHVCDDCPLHDDMQACDNHAVYEVHIGPKDMDMITRLIKAGTDEAKFMRYIDVTVDITAPLYWWKEFDTYKVGTVANSCSTMHKIHDKEFTMDDFSHEHLLEDEVLNIRNVDACTPGGFMFFTVKVLNHYRDLYNMADKKLKGPAMLTEAERKHITAQRKAYWWQMIQLLPSSYNQRRTVKLNYQVLRAMYFARRNHKLDEWRDGFCEWVESLPYSELITMNGKYEDLVNRHADLMKQYHELELKCNELQEKADMYDELACRFDFVRENINPQINVDIEVIKSCRAALRDEVDRLRDELAEVRNENTNLKNHLSEMYDECILKGADKEFGDI